MNDDIQAVPELLPQRKKGSVWVNVIIRILNKRSPISSDNRDNTFQISTFSAISIEFRLLVRYQFLATP
jgi:hypothetical protein